MKPFKPYAFLLICLGFCALMFFIENNNNSFLLNDLKVYYEASRAFVNNGEPYGQAFGLSSGFFKYSPATLLAFLPYTVFSFETVRVIHFILISLMAYAVFKLCLDLCERYLPELKRPKPLAFLCWLLFFSVVHLTRELHMGNLNLALILLSLLGLRFALNNKDIPAAITLAVLFLVKPYFGILVLPLVIARKWRLLAYTFTGMVLISLLPALVVGMQANIELHKAWFETMQSHNTGMFSEHTFSSIVFSYTGVQLGSNLQYLFILLTMLIFMAIRFPAFRQKSTYSATILLGDSLVLMALIPNLVITDSQHFLFSIPLIAFILKYVAEKRSWIAIGIFAVLFFFYGANANDLLGNPLSNLFDQYSTIGVANLGLIVFFLVLRQQANAFSK